MMNFKYLITLLSLCLIAFLLFRQYHKHNNHPSHPYPLPKLPLNPRPIIGVLTQPSKYFSPTGVKQSYIASSYVKYLESAGAQVIPILYDYDEMTLKTIFNQLNGLFFPGGDASLFKTNKYGIFGNELTKFSKTGKFLVNLVVDSNANGNYFPLFGTCLGHELISVIISQNYDLLTPIQSENHCNNIQFNSNLNISKIFKEVPQSIRDYVRDNQGAYFNHQNAVLYSKYENEDYLREFFHITSYSWDIHNKTKFIASFEGKNDPVFTWQFHPEKAVFEWKTTDDINHSKEIIKFSTYLTNFMVEEARKNGNTIDDDTLSRLSIYNYKTTREDESSFEQMYFFDELSSKK